MTKQKTWSEEVVLAELKRYVEHFGSTQGLSKNCKGLYQKIKAHGDNGTEFYLKKLYGEKWFKYDKDYLADLWEEGDYLEKAEPMLREEADLEGDSDDTHDLFTIEPQSLEGLNLRRGDVVMVKLLHEKGCTITTGQRPGVIVSSYRRVKGNSCVIVPFTSKEKSYSFIKPSRMNGLGCTSYVLGSKVQCVDNRQIVTRMGTLSDYEMKVIDRELSLNLDMRTA